MVYSTVADLVSCFPQVWVKPGTMPEAAVVDVSLDWMAYYKDSINRIERFMNAHYKADARPEFQTIHAFKFAKVRL